MIQFLKRLFRWLVTPPKEDPPSSLLDVVIMVDGHVEHVQLHVTGVVGVSLCGRLIGPVSGTRIVGEASAVDKRHFWALWKHLSGGMEFVWEDGTPFDPSEHMT